MALVLGSVGLYGVIAYIVSQRTREIGVRIALGADARLVRRLVLRQGMTLVGLGLTAGITGAYGLTRFLESLLFGVTPTDPLTFAAVGSAFALVSLGASYLPARRILRVDPVTVLKVE